LRFVVSAHGKPELAEPRTPPLAFNLSYCQSVALCAVARRQVGVDIEAWTALDHHAVAAAVYSAHDRARLREVPDSELETAFFRFWTRWEAVAKASGLGLSMPREELRIAFEGWTAVINAPAADGRMATWCVRDLPVGPGLSAAVAVEGRGALRPRLMTWRPGSSMPWR
jgi:4'-phosphopantetheinyl transferase